MREEIKKMCIDEKTSLGCEGFCASISALEKENATLKAWNEYYKSALSCYYDEYMTLHNDHMDLLDKIEKKNQEIQYLVDRANKMLETQRERLDKEIQHTLKILHSEE